MNSKRGVEGSVILSKPNSSYSSVEADAVAKATRDGVDVPIYRKPKGGYTLVQPVPDRFGPVTPHNTIAASTEKSMPVHQLPEQGIKAVMTAKGIIEKMATVLELVNELETDTTFWHSLPENTKTAVVRVLNEYDAYKTKA